MPRGVRDYSPGEAISIKYIIGVVEEVFKRFGFYPLETPSVESTSVLNAKSYGEESAKELYKIEGEDTGLRYDLTVSLARYVASNKDLAMPFRRYQIGTAWRKEEPQRMRHREFIDADADIVGSREVESDAEVIAANAIALEELGIREYALLINSRVLLKEILGLFKVPESKQVQAIRAIDKLQKLSRDEVLEQMKSLGLEAQKLEELLNFIEQEGGNEEKLERLSAEIEGAKEETDKLKELLNALKEYKLSGRIIFDLSLARGLDYYTGFVWEFVVEEDGKRLPTLAAGGRYDNLIGVYSKKSIPAVGSSIGITRVFDMLNTEGGVKTYAKVFIAYIGANRAYAVSVANMLRGNGVYTDLNSLKRNLSKQLEYANSLGIMYVAIIGDKEREASKIKLRNMLNGNEETLGVQEAIEKLKS